jgi:cobalt-precorrin 5A hydrolase
MVLDQAMIIAGVGCRRGASAREVEVAIARALARRNLAPTALGLIATAEAKANEAGISEAAAALGVKLALIASEQLAAASANVATKSERVQELIGVPSVAEAAALAAGGTEARLLAPRIVVGPVTCALGEVP